MKSLVLIALIFFGVLHVTAADLSKPFFIKKNITVTVDEKGGIYIGNDTLTSDQLIDEVQKRLWKSYMGTGKMYDAIHLEFEGKPSSAIKETARKSIHEAQQKALIDVCLQKHKKLYEDLSNQQQRKIRKEFPVLFQQNY